MAGRNSIDVKELLDKVDGEAGVELFRTLLTDVLQVLLEGTLGREGHPPKPLAGDRLSRFILELAPPEVQWTYHLLQSLPQ